MLLWATTLLLACQDAAEDASPAPAVDPSTIIATVGEVPITEDEYQQAAARWTPEDGNTLSDAEKRQVLDTLVDEKILYLEALRMGLDKDPKVQRVIVNTILRQEVYSKVQNNEFSDEDLKAYYQQHKDEFTFPAKVHVKRILLRITDERDEAATLAEALRIRKELKKAPHQFKELAAQYSEGPYKRRGGDLGFLSQDGKKGVDQALIDKAFEMQLQEISEPFMTDEGYNILMIANSRKETKRSFQQMKGTVLRKLKNERLQQVNDEYLSSLKGEGSPSIEVDDSKLLAIEVQSRPNLSMRPGLDLQRGADEDKTRAPQPGPGDAAKSDAPAEE